MTHDERVWHHEMETCEGIHEHAERIAALEELVLDMDALLNVFCVSEDGYGCNCPAWPDHTKECDVRVLEGRAHSLGL